jgi:hydrogenase maturation protease
VTADPRRTHPDTPGPAGGVLVIGYGNPLRGDDGVGPAVAAAVAADPRGAGARVLALHQLTPELAVDLAGARLAIFVDATVEAGPGQVVTRRPAAGVPAVAGGGAGPSSHHVGIDALIVLARELYGSAPEVAVVSVGVADLETGDRLSAAVAAAVPAAVEAVLALIAGG